LSELAATLSLAADFAHGAEAEHQLRVSIMAARLAEELGLAETERRNCYDAALLHWLGCTATAQALSGWYGDEIEAHRHVPRFARPLDPLLDLLRHAGAGKDLPHRLLVLLDALRAGPGAVFGATCEASTVLAGRLGYSPEVVAALGVAFERFDGKGWPGKLRGDAIPVAAQVAMLADDAVALADLDGEVVAMEEIRRRAGTHYGPDMVAALNSLAADTFAEFVGADAWQLAAACDPLPDRLIAPEAVAETLTAVADFVDIKVPGLAGHSRGVAELAAAAATELGESSEVVDLLRHSGLVHDLGRVTVSNDVWTSAGSLSSAQRERVRLCPYHAERFCARSAWLAPLGALGAQHQERLDGSGYHRGLAAAAISRPARILQAADCYRALIEDRSHRAALAPEAAAEHVRSEARAGRLDPDAVEAMIAAAGQRARVRRAHPAGLTAREVEVLGLLAQGLPNKQIASRLVVSSRTVGTHVAHIYEKIGVATRAGATLFALRHDLVETSVKRPM
jgi:HD-GYP domain-containing protein (c-di-GMP phosphodiesterase class II)